MEEPAEADAALEAAAAAEAPTAEADANDDGADTATSCPFLFSTEEFSQIGRYDREKQLGIGGFGVVYKYKLKEPDQGAAPGHPSLPPAIAVKVLSHVEDIQSPKRLRLHREVNVTGDCDHLNIVRCFGVCEVDGVTALALELCKRDLSSFLRNSPGRRLGREQTRHILYQVSSALCYLFSIRIVHRDLKPQNILVRDEITLEICISDFGLAKVLRPSSDPTMTRVGTPEYSAPEMQGIHGEAQLLNLSEDVGHASDVYSLGVIGFELVTGQRPPQAVDEARVTKWLREEIKGIHDWKLCDLLRVCLRWKPEDRIKKDRLLLHQFLLLHNTDLVSHLKEAEVLPGGLKFIKYDDRSGKKQEHIAIETPILNRKLPEDKPVLDLTFQHDALVPQLGTACNQGYVVIITERPRFQKTLGEFLEERDIHSPATILSIMRNVLELLLELETHSQYFCYLHHYQLEHQIFVDPKTLKLSVLLPRSKTVDLQDLAMTCKPEGSSNGSCATLLSLSKWMQSHLTEESLPMKAVDRALRKGKNWGQLDTLKAALNAAQGKKSDHLQELKAFWPVLVLAAAIIAVLLGRAFAVLPTSTTTTLPATSTLNSSNVTEVPDEGSVTEVPNEVHVPPDPPRAPPPPPDGLPYSAVVILGGKHDRLVASDARDIEVVAMHGGPDRRFCSGLGSLPTLGKCTLTVANGSSIGVCSESGDCFVHEGNADDNSWKVAQFSMNNQRREFTSVPLNNGSTVVLGGKHLPSGNPASTTEMLSTTGDPNAFVLPLRRERGGGALLRTVDVEMGTVMIRNWQWRFHVPRLAENG